MSTRSVGVTEVISLIDKVESDVTLSATQRARARKLRANLSTPTVALERLQATARSVLPALQRVASTKALARAVTCETFRAYVARQEVRAAFATGEDLQRYIEGQPNKASALKSMLPDSGSLFSWERSWLAEAAPLREMSGADLSLALELEKDPPFVIFHFSVGSMEKAGVLVRPPCSLDSVLGPNLQWRPGGPASGIEEYIDGDLPVQAVTSVEWRP